MGDIYDELSCSGGEIRLLCFAPCTITRFCSSPLFSSSPKIIFQKYVNPRLLRPRGGGVNNANNIINCRQAHITGSHAAQSLIFQRCRYVQTLEVAATEPTQKGGTTSMGSKTLGFTRTIHFLVLSAAAWRRRRGSRWWITCF